MSTKVHSPPRSIWMILWTWLTTSWIAIQLMNLVVVFKNLMSRGANLVKKTSQWRAVWLTAVVIALILFAAFPVWNLVATWFPETSAPGLAIAASAITLLTFIVLAALRYHAKTLMQMLGTGRWNIHTESLFQGLFVSKRLTALITRFYETMIWQNFTFWLAEHAPMISTAQATPIGADTSDSRAWTQLKRRIMRVIPATSSLLSSNIVPNSPMTA